MSCNYFILTKPNKKNVHENDCNQIYYPNAKTYILPYSNFPYYIQNGLFEKYLIDWSRQYCDKTKTMLDIGSHSGTYCISLSDDCANIYAFEPQRLTYYSLCGSVALSNIKNINCINVGLGSEDQVGDMLLNIVSLDGGGSTLHTDDSIQILNTESVKIITLDSLNLLNIGFIKIDVEGNELNVLKGSLNTLKNSNYPKILFESNYENPYLFKFLTDLKYNIIKVNTTNMYLATM